MWPNARRSQIQAEIRTREKVQQVHTKKRKSKQLVKERVCNCATDPSNTFLQQVLVQQEDLDSLWRWAIFLLFIFFSLPSLGCKRSKHPRKFVKPLNKKFIDVLLAITYRLCMVVCWLPSWTMKRRRKQEKERVNLHKRLERSTAQSIDCARSFVAERTFKLSTHARGPAGMARHVSAQCVRQLQRSAGRVRSCTPQKNAKTRKTWAFQRQTHKVLTLMFEPNHFVVSRWPDSLHFGRPTWHLPFYSPVGLVTGNYPRQAQCVRCQKREVTRCNAHAKALVMHACHYIVPPVWPMIKQWINQTRGIIFLSPWLVSSGGSSASRLQHVWRQVKQKWWNGHQYTNQVLPKKSDCHKYQQSHFHSQLPHLFPPKTATVVHCMQCMVPSPARVCLKGKINSK